MSAPGPDAWAAQWSRQVARCATAAEVRDMLAGRALLDDLAPPLTDAMRGAAATRIAELERGAMRRAR